MWLINYTGEYARMLSVGTQGVLTFRTQPNKTMPKRTRVDQIDKPEYSLRCQIGDRDCCSGSKFLRTQLKHPGILMSLAFNRLIVLINLIYQMSRISNAYRVNKEFYIYKESL